MKKVVLIILLVVYGFSSTALANFFIENKGQIQINDLKVLYYSFYQNYQIYVCKDKMLIYDTEQDTISLNYEFDNNGVSKISSELNMTYLNYYYSDFKVEKVKTFSNITLLDNYDKIKLSLTFNDGVLNINTNDNTFINLKNNIENKKIKNGTDKLLSLEGIVWSTLFGGSQSDQAVYSVLDQKSNNIYFAGMSRSPDYPVKDNHTVYAQQSDIIINKFNMNGSLIWATIMGSSGNEYIHSAALDSSGNLWVSGDGFNARNFPVTSNAFQRGYRGGTADGILVKFSNDGFLRYATLLGGDGYEGLTNICVDKYNNIWGVGRTNSSNFPVTANAQKKYIDEGYETPIFKFTSDGTLIYSSLFGGTSKGALTLADAITTNSNGDIIIAGYTNSSTLPCTPDAFQRNIAGSWDSFLAKFNQSYQNVYTTYIGGNSADYGSNITIDKNENIYLMHYSYSSNLPLINSTLNTSNSGVLDIYLTKFDVNFNLIWATYFGGKENEGEDFGGYQYIGGGIAITPNNSVAIYFKTRSYVLHTSTNAIQKNLGGYYDSFILLLDSTLNFKDATYFGGNNTEYAGNITAISDSTFIICGLTMSNNFPLKNPIQSTRKGESDQFMAILGNKDYIPSPRDSIPPTITSSVDSCEIIRTISVADNQLDLSGIKDINIIQSDNCDISITNKTQTTAVIIIHLIDTEQNGYYTIDVIDNAGNKTTLKDSLLASSHNYLSFTPTPLYDYGKINFGQKVCKNLTIHNKSANEISINEIYVAKNLDFSIPQSQFPLFVPANDSINLEVCFMAKFPLYGIYRDTLLYFSECVYARTALAAEIDTSSYYSTSRCDVIIDITSNYDSLSYPEPLIYPNPNRGMVWIDSDYKKGDITLEVYNILGEQVSQIQIKTASLPFQIDLSNLENGNYILLIRQNNTLSIKKITLIK